jgi:hypothetical protein
MKFEDCDTKARLNHELLEPVCLYTIKSDMANSDMY